MIVKKILEVLDYHDIFNACVQKIHKCSLVTRILWNVWLHKGKNHSALKKNKYGCLICVCSYTLLCIPVWQQESDKDQKDQTDFLSCVPAGTEDIFLAISQNSSRQSRFTYVNSQWTDFCWIIIQLGKWILSHLAWYSL